MCVSSRQVSVCGRWGSSRCEGEGKEEAGKAQARHVARARQGKDRERQVAWWWQERWWWSCVSADPGRQGIRQEGRRSKARHNTRQAGRKAGKGKGYEGREEASKGMQAGKR